MERESGMVMDKTSNTRYKSIPCVQDTEVNTMIMRVSATDVDEGENQRITYELTHDRFPGDLEYFR